MISVKELDYEDDGRVTYKGTFYSGIANDFWQSGKLFAEVSYIEGLLDGCSKEWYESGALKEEEIYTEGRVIKISNWHENGQLKLLGEYEFGIPLWEKKWDEQGNLIENFILTEENPRFRTLQMLRKIKSEQENK